MCGTPAGNEGDSGSVGEDMNITVPFSINQEVLIIPISQPGTIIEIRITEGNPIYVMEYWWEGKLQVANVSAKDIVETRK